MVLPNDGKPVRDRIPEIIRLAGQSPQVSELDPRDMPAALKLKLLEEVQEVIDADEASLIEELADVLEVLLSIAHIQGISWRSVESKSIQKRAERGGFGAGLWLHQSDRISKSE